MPKSIVKWKEISSSYYCDCCGSYSCKDVNISIDDCVLDTFSYDGHFGGGTWNGYDWSLYQKIFEFIGIGFKFEESITNFEDIEFADLSKHTPCVSGYYYETTDFEGKNLQVAEIKVSYTRVSFITADGTTDYFDNVQQFDGCILGQSFSIKADSFEAFYEQLAYEFFAIDKTHRYKNHYQN